MDVRTRIEQAVEQHREEALALLQALVRAPSLEGNEKQCQEIAARHLRASGMEVDMWEPLDAELAAHPAYVPTGKSYADRPNVIGIWRGTGGGRSLKLNGHVDVVPTGPAQTWSVDPFGGEFINGRVYGRGSADMKGGVVANILTAQALKTAGIRLKGDLIVEIVVDEEAGGNGTLAAIMRGYTADGCIFTEPTGLHRIAVSNRGAQYFRIIVAGQEGGTEYKYQLVNPITKGLEVFQAVEAYAIMRESQASHPLYDDHHTRVPTGICKFHCGEWPSTIASQAVLEGTIECLPGEDIHAVKENFRKYLMEWSGKDAWLKEHPLRLEWFGLWFDAAEIPPQHPLISTIVQVTQDVTGIMPVPGGGGGSDLRLPILYGSTPAVLFGPAGAMIHSTDEYVEFEEVIKCAKVLANIAVEWCGAS